MCLLRLSSSSFGACICTLLCRQSEYNARLILLAVSKVNALKSTKNKWRLEMTTKEVYWVNVCEYSLFDRYLLCLRVNGRHCHCAACAYSSLPAPSPIAHRRISVSSVHCVKSCCARPRRARDAKMRQVQPSASRGDVTCVLIIFLPFVSLLAFGLRGPATHVGLTPFVGFLELVYRLYSDVRGQ